MHLSSKHTTSSTGNDLTLHSAYKRRLVKTLKTMCTLVVAFGRWTDTFGAQAGTVVGWLKRVKFANGLHHCTSWPQYTGVIKYCVWATFCYNLTVLGRPTYLSRTYICFTTDSSFFLSSFFRRLISELVKQNSTKIGHMLGSKCNLQTHVRNLGYPAYKSGPQNHLFRRLRNLMAHLTAYILGRKHDFEQSVKYVDIYKGSTTSSQNVMNCGRQMPSNWTAIFTHPM